MFVVLRFPEYFYHYVTISGLHCTVSIIMINHSPTTE